MSARSTALRWLREPLVQFLLAGGALFAVWQALHPTEARDTTRIELTQDDLKQMTVGWLAQGRPAPSSQQMRGLVETRVREEILYREALALGLDRDDTIVKRRLAQKMEFLGDDVAAVRDPAPGELEDWFAVNSARFATPPRASFRHVYFSFDRRGDKARAAATAALAQRGGADHRGLVDASGDAFMFQDRYTDRTPEQVAALFGPTFAQGLFQQSPGSWQGPIESGYGWHLVFVDGIEPAATPAFEEAKDAARDAWLADQRAASKRSAYDAMRARYEVVLPDDVQKVASGASGAPSFR